MHDCVLSPAERAAQLLQQHLDGEQREMLKKCGGFPIKKKNRVYWIPLLGAIRCAHLDAGKVDTYCVHIVSEGELPLSDRALTYLLWIKWDPSNFHVWTNVTRRTSIAPGTPPSKAIARFARTCAAQQVRRTRPRIPAPVQLPRATEEELRLTKRCASRIRSELRKADLRELLRKITGEEPDPAVLADLTARRPTPITY